MSDMQWRTIESAPKDGTRVLLYENEIDGQTVGFWSTCLWVDHGGAWVIYEARSDTITLEPKNWMPLPSPPSDDSEAQAGSMK